MNHKKYLIIANQIVDFMDLFAKNKYFNIITVCLTIIFTQLKIYGIGIIATWSWWYVLSPSYIIFLFILIICLILGISKIVYGKCLMFE